MKKIKILFLLLLIFNIIFASILVIDIQFFESPNISATIDVLDVNSEEIIIRTNIEISNPNSFELIVSDLEVESKTDSESKVGNIKIEGGNVPSNGKKLFKSTDKLSFKSNDFKTLENKVNARVGVNILGFIKKTIPLKLTIVASIDKLFEKLKQPVIKINSYFDDINVDGLNFSTSIDVYNPTGFEFNIDTLLLDIFTNENENVGSITIHGDVVEPNSSKIFNANGIIFYDSLDAETLWMNLTGVAGAKIAGIQKDISFSTDASFEIPEIKDFIFQNETVDFGLPIQLKFTPFGIMGTVGFRIYNPSNIPLVAKNLVCGIYRLDGSEKTLLGEEAMDACEIAPRKTICTKTQIRVPYLKFLFSDSGQFLPDWIILRIEGDFSIAGTRQSFPISVNGFVDPHLLRNSEFASFEA